MYKIITSCIFVLILGCGEDNAQQIQNNITPKKAIDTQNISNNIDKELSLGIGTQLSSLPLVDDPLEKVGVQLSSLPEIDTGVQLSGLPETDTAIQTSGLPEIDTAIQTSGLPEIDILKEEDKFRENDSVTAHDSSTSSSKKTDVSYKANIVDDLIDRAYNIYKNINKNITIDGKSYLINSNLIMPNKMRIGFSSSIKNIFLGSNDDKGYLFSPQRYIAIYNYNTQFEEFKNNYWDLKKTVVVYRITQNRFSFKNAQITYKSPAKIRECIASTYKEFTINLTKNNGKIGEFRLTCNIETGELTSINGSTKFSKKYEDSFNIQIGGALLETKVPPKNICKKIEQNPKIQPPDIPKCVSSQIYK